MTNITSGLETPRLSKNIREMSWKLTEQFCIIHNKKHAAKM